MSEEKERTQIGMKKNEPPTHKLHFRKPLKSGMHLERKNSNTYPKQLTIKLPRMAVPHKYVGAVVFFGGVGRAQTSRLHLRPPTPVLMAKRMVVKNIINKGPFLS